VETPFVRRLIESALDEDIGSGDITTSLLVNRDQKGLGTILSKEPLILAGLSIAVQVFSTLDADLEVRRLFQDGDAVSTGTVVLEVRGRMAALLQGERTALNFLQRLSGIATHVADYVRAVEGKRLRIVDTRKTTPGWRTLEKYAVRMGGASNHRMGLFDGILIKDNHIRACGTIRKAVRRARKGASHLHKIEVEIEDLNQIAEALEAGADVILLDNMDLPRIRNAVDRIRGRALVEVSGRIQKRDLPLLAEAGVDLVSMGALTHSASAVDLGMDIEPID